MNGQSLTIVGVAPEGFSGTIPGFRPQVFVPLTLRWLMEPTRPRDEADRRAYWVYLFARLKPDVAMEQAAAGINALYGSILNEIEAPLNTSMADELLAQFRQRQITLAPGARGQSWVPAGAAQPLTLLLGITVVVLLIVCVNIANLLLARGASRVGEMAIRVSIGASRWRLVSLLLTEISVPAVIGSLLSVPVAALTVYGFTATLPEWLAGAYALELNSTAFLFAAAVSLSTVVLFSVVPAVQVTRVSPGLAVKGQGSQTLGGHGMARFRTVLATTQIGFSMVLLVLAGLFTQSLVNVARVDLGMNVDSVVTFTVSPRMNGRDAADSMAIFDRIEERLAAEPGVASVGSARIALLTRRGSTSAPAFEGAEVVPGADGRVLTNDVSPGFFTTLAIPVVDRTHVRRRGRARGAARGRRQRELGAPVRSRPGAGRQALLARPHSLGHRDRRRRRRHAVPCRERRRAGANLLAAPAERQPRRCDVLRARRRRRCAATHDSSRGRGDRAGARGR